MHGTINFSEVEGGKVHVQGIITGMPPGEYGFHVHEKGDISGGCGTTGSHFNPEKVRMGDTELLGMESNSNFFFVCSVPCKYVNEKTYNIGGCKTSGYQFNDEDNFEIIFE